jgi:formylglycine-generating enzyme required for sulfatase activity
MSQTLVGSAEYLAPEQAKRRGTYASDLYSLGVTALYLLTGASPWDLESDESFGQWHWREFAQAQGTVLSSNLAAVIDRLIAKSLSDRFRTATSALEALQGTGGGTIGGSTGTTQGAGTGALPLPPPPKPVEILTLPLPNGQETIEFVKIPPGILRMDQGFLITLQGFYMAKYPITQRQYSAVINNNPSRFKGDLDRPVECVSWKEAVKFCEIFNAQSNLNGRKIQLPSETQWEYACRAGTNTKFWFGNDDKDLEKHAWYSGNSRKGKGLILGLVGGSTHSVYERAEAHTNPWGLVDMHGHVWEWCQDKWVEEVEKLPKDGTSFNGWTLLGGRAVRGGSWNLDTDSCRSGSRHNTYPDNSNLNQGFRVVLLLS